MTNENKKRTRLMVDITPELRRRIKVAAALNDTSVKQYIVDILEDSVPTEDSEASEALDKRGIITAEAIGRLDETRKKIMQGRRFSVDSVELINEARRERTEEL